MFIVPSHNEIFNKNVKADFDKIVQNKTRAINEGPVSNLSLITMKTFLARLRIVKIFGF